MKKKTGFFIFAVITLFVAAICVTIHITKTIQQNKHEKYVELLQNPLVFVSDSTSYLGKLPNSSYWVEKENSLIKIDWANETVRFFSLNDLFFRVSGIWPPAFKMVSCSNEEFEKYAYEHFGVLYDKYKLNKNNASLFLMHPDQEHFLFMRIFWDVSTKKGSVTTLSENFVTKYVGVFKNI